MGQNKTRKVWDGRFAAGCITAAALFGVAAGMFLNSIGIFLDRTKTEGAKQLQDAIVRASVQCYAIEGRYPPSVEYLECEYGIQIDREQYAVFYNGFASNLMPEITVILLEQEGGGQHEAE